MLSPEKHTLVPCVACNANRCLPDLPAQPSVNEKVPDLRWNVDHEVRKPESPGGGVILKTETSEHKSEPAE